MRMETAETEPIELPDIETDEHLKTNAGQIAAYLKAIRRYCDLIEERLRETRPNVGPRSTAATLILAFLEGPGGLLRTQGQLATILGQKDRTVAWAMNKLKKHNAVVRRSSDARWSSARAWAAFDALEGEARIDAAVMNELDFRFRHPKLTTGWGRDIYLLPDVGGLAQYEASLKRLVAAGKVKLDAQGRIVKPGLPVKAPPPAIDLPEFEGGEA